MEYIISKNNVTAVVKSYGAELVSCKVGDREVVFEGNPEFWAGQNPNLFPSVGRSKDGIVNIDGTDYEMCQHGFARNCEFELVSKTDDEVTLVFSGTEESLKMYPFKYNFYVTHTVVENGFKTTYKVENKDDKAIYYALGGHTAINWKLNADEKLSDNTIKFNKTETNAVYQAEADKTRGVIPIVAKQYTNIDSFKPNHDIFKDDAVVFEEVVSDEIKIENDNTGTGAKIAIEGFKTFLIWMPFKDGNPFVCFEPWTKKPDFVTDTVGFMDQADKLEAGATSEYSYTITIF